MTAPVLASVAAELYRGLLPLAYADPQHDYPLAKYVAGIGGQYQDIDDVVRDTPAGPGWSARKAYGKPLHELYDLRGPLLVVEMEERER